MQHHKYSLTELENMMPWERNLFNFTTIYVRRKFKAQQASNA